MGPVVFDYAVWAALFPELSGVSEGMATNYFNMALLYINPYYQGNSPYWSNLTNLTMILNLATAHIAKLLSQQTNGQSTTGGAEAPSPIVGRINNASEGSVSVATEMPTQQPNAAWWNQTPYGAAVWASGLFKVRRLMRYLPGPRRIYNPPVFRGW